MSTKQKILDTALLLFNQKGERAVSTNHIAAELNISPGNLYYHYENKQAIVHELFLCCEQRMLDILELPAGRALTEVDKVNYLKNVFSGLWEYRFFHRDMEYLLGNQTVLHQRYQSFFQQCLKKVRAIYQGLADAGMLEISQQDIDALALNAWVVVTSWFSFLRCSMGVDEDEDLSQQMLWGGIYQVFILEKPYLKEEYRLRIEALQGPLISPPGWIAD